VRAQDDGGVPAAGNIRHHHALARDVILGIVAVIFVSLAVPASILRVEYRKTYDAPVKPGSTAEVLRERTSETAIITTPRAPSILEVAERVVRQEAEEREAKRRATVHSRTTRSTNVPVPPTAAHPAPVVSPVVNAPQVDSQRPTEAP
jgi:hypothetical protein